MSRRQDEYRTLDPNRVIRIRFEFECDEAEYRDERDGSTRTSRRVVVGRRTTVLELVIDPMKCAKKLASKATFAKSGRSRGLSGSIHMKRLATSAVKEADQ